MGGDGVANTTGVTRDRIVAAITKYDTNGSGVLEQDQVLHLLAVYGESLGVTPTDDDVRFVLETADVSHTNSLTKDEVLPAIATWRELAAQKAATPDATPHPCQKACGLGAGQCAIA